MIAAAQINSILRAKDIEGLIESGAPSDEYHSEAIDIAKALQALSVEEFNQENILAILSAIWARNFNLDNAGLNLRMSALEKLAKEILKN